MDYSRLVIYMADDDDDDRFFMRRSLQSVYPALTLVEAEDGDELLTLLDNWSRQPAHQPVHLILLDMNMPKVNGIETLAALKANPLLQHIPAVMVSTSDEPTLVVTAYQAGASGYVKKPASYEHLDQIVRSIGGSFLGGVAN